MHHAVRWSVEHFQDYLRGVHITVRTDHHSLLWMKEALDAKVFRWSMYLSRLPTSAEEDDPDEEYIFPPTPTQTTNLEIAAPAAVFDPGEGIHIPDALGRASRHPLHSKRYL
eukprot:GHVS01014531.1.p2 GENE.GHVS01014531.1~~GHVS01014531.1.p2  ORF type:complete len:112 (+),score=12.40 GHVS01014531.1:470-805(+)